MSAAMDEYYRNFGRWLEDFAMTITKPRAERRTMLAPGECSYCDRERTRNTADGYGPFMPPHDASPNCESGKHNHCTCDTCF